MNQNVFAKAFIHQQSGTEKVVTSLGARESYTRNLGGHPLALQSMHTSYLPAIITVNLDPQLRL